ncbi:DNA glycosylase [Sistotremastrum niveocremeum HHB9708]|uniref:DNA glycosylase n=1 Tax=Sistotremastrum niveocremeum HHB9708 TaxID=1314777 RepID=A0A164YYY4_9AGAM|nr:DNA glycosylase [Sistotremastrum niveocremeum HHB9708]
MYSHLKPLPDHLDYDLDIVFCGINPGKLSATTGHHFSKSSNSFWKCLRDSGLTPGTLIPPDQDYTLPERYRYGLTNVVERPSTSESELSASEKAACVIPCLTKIMRYRPKILCILGIGIWQVIEKQLKSLSTLSGLRLETPPNPEDVSPPVIIGEKSVAMGDNVGLRPYVLVYKKMERIQRTRP